MVSPMRIVPTHPSPESRVLRARRLSIAALAAGALVLAGCGGQEPPGGPMESPTAPPDACDPLTNTGCPSDQKCSVRVESETPFVTTVTCVPAGYVSEGGQCGFGAPGQAGFDDCVGTTFCLDGVCTAICADEPGGCADPDRACTPYGGVFGDAGLGLCTPRCDPTAAQSCAGDQGCYVRLGTGEAACSEAGDRGQDQVCSALNACAAGLGCVLLAPEGEDNLCTAFCDPATGATASGGTCADALGGQALLPSCVPINQFYADTPDVPDEVGMCLDCAEPAYSAIGVCARSG